MTINPKEQRKQEHHALNEDLKTQAYRAAIERLKAR